MELNKEIQKILLDFEILSQENEWTKEEKEIRSVYDTFRIQNIINSTIPVVSKRNWFEKIPLHWRLLYYFIGGTITGLLLPYVC